MRRRRCKQRHRIPRPLYSLTWLPFGWLRFIEGGSGVKSFLPRPALHRHNAGAMNYKHIYHAGNFADVAKHVGLLYCLKALRRKEAPFFVLDTHAGRGYYNLGSAEAQKSAE